MYELPQRNSALHVAAVIREQIVHLTNCSQIALSEKEDKPDDQGTNTPSHVG
jgi:hypothetical protein